jgi:hypothetical protein
MGDIQREKSKDPIISEPAYIHATNGTIVRVPVTLHVRPNQPALHLHSGTCEDDVSISSPADRSRDGAEGTDVVRVPEGLSSGNGMEGVEGTEQNQSSPDSTKYRTLQGLRCLSIFELRILEISYSGSPSISTRGGGG